MSPQLKTARNIAIILLLAAILALVPGGGNVAEAIYAAISITFLALIGFAGYQMYRQNRFAYLALEERMRLLFIAALGALVLMIAGADELTRTGAGLLVWLGVIGLAVFAIVRVVAQARSSY